MCTFFGRLSVTLWLAVAAVIHSVLPALALPIPQISATIEGPSVTQSEYWGGGIFFGWEGSGPIRLVVRVFGAASEPATHRVHYRVDASSEIWGPGDEIVEAARLGRDFQIASLEGDLDFDPGITERSIEVSLPNDTEMDGPRYLAFRLSGVNDIPPFLTSGIGFIILDDEFPTLKQQVVLDPYFDLSHHPQITQNAGSGYYVTGDSTILRLGNDGLPDSTFGLGSGRAILPRVRDGHKIIYYPYMGQLEVRPDGGLQFVAGIEDTDRSVVVRLTATGLPDSQFGSGTGVVEIAGQLHRTANGDFLVKASPEGWRLSRLTPDFAEDPNFAPWNSSREVRYIQVTSQGTIWVGVYSIETGSALLRLGPSGVPDSKFVERLGVAFSRGVDALGRAYFQLNDPVGFGDSTQGELVRFKPDGSYDTAYRPLMGQPESSFLEVAPTGAALAILSDFETSAEVVLEIDSIGSVKRLYEFGLAHAAHVPHLVSSRRRSDGLILLSFMYCSDLGGSCSSWNEILSPEGISSRVPIGEPNLPEDLQTTWSWSEYRRDISQGFRNDRLWRTIPPNAPNQVGVTSTGIYAWESSIEITLRRSGSNTLPARVQGKVLPKTGGSLDEQAAIPFDLEFQAGQGEVTLTLPQLAQSGRQRLREYLVRLERATGVELGLFTSCRIWVLDDESRPSEQSLHLEKYPGLDEPGVVLLLGRWNTQRSNGYTVLSDPNQTPYLTRPEQPFELGPIWLKAIRTDRENQQFFKPYTFE